VRQTLNFQQSFTTLNQTLGFGHQNRTSAKNFEPGQNLWGLSASNGLSEPVGSKKFLVVSGF
jgi:hypothetical protein